MTFDLEKTTQLKYLLLAVIVCGGLIACGPQKSGDSEDFGSTDPGGASFSTLTELYNNGYVACSRDIAAYGDFGAKVMLFIDPISGTINQRYLRLKFDRFPTNYYGTSNNPSFAVWGATVSSNGVEAPAQQLAFSFEKHVGGSFQPLGSGQPSYYSANWQDLKNLISYHGFSYTSGDMMMKDVTLLIDLASFADAPNLVVKVASYDSTPTLLKTLNILTPYFKANPNEYYTNHPLVLRNIHPLSYMSTGTWTQSQFVSESQKNCF